MSDSFRCADIEPARDRVSHTLIINGLPAARFDELKKAIDARQLVIKEALEQRPCHRIEPQHRRGGG